jgi:CheY-like chemotaxis protein/HPt (histidine-containing phosphotransfer) domain-containing protein
VVAFEVSSSPDFEAYQLQKDGYSADDLFGLRVLLAEDNEHNQLVAVDTLKKVIQDAEIIVATNGLEVLNLLNSRSQHLFSTNDESNDSLLPFDIILMDVQMPELDGYETTRRIRTTLPSPLNQIPIIALTASVVRSDLKKCTEAGMNSYIAKPFSKDDLVREIGKVLQRNTVIKERTLNAVSVKNDNSLIPNNTKQHSYSPDHDNGVSFKQLYEICGDDLRARRDYLLQFLELVPARLKNLKRSLEENNRPAVRLAAHKLKPQLGFFGMRAEELLANRIETKAQKLSYDDMQLLIAQLEEGCKLAARAIGQELERS